MHAAEIRQDGTPADRCLCGAPREEFGWEPWFPGAMPPGVDCTGCRCEGARRPAPARIRASSGDPYGDDLAWGVDAALEARHFG